VFSDRKAKPEAGQGHNLAAEPSRREFLARLAQAGIGVGAIGIEGTRGVFAQRPPSPPGNVKIGAPVRAQPEGAYLITGEILNGATVTVVATGGGFGIKPNGEKPLFWLPFETDVNLSALSRAASYGGTINGTLGTSVLAPNSVGSLGWDLRGNNSGQTQIIMDDFPLGSNNPKVYISAKRNHDFDIVAKAATNTLTPNDFNNKVFHLVTSPFGTPYLWTWHERYEATFVSGQYYHTVNDTDRPRPLPDDFPWYGSSWITHELVFDPGTADTQDCRFEWWRQGRCLYPTTMRTYCLTTGCTPIIAVAVDHMNQYVGDSAYVYYDSLYVDDSWCRVVISDETTYAATAYGPAATPYLREIQIPTAWADGAVSFVLRQGSHASLSNKCLYVVTSDGTATKAGSFS
jgi:hypothetical protein